MKIKNIVLALTSVLLFAGCGDDPAKTLDKVSSNMSKLDNYEMNMTLNMGIKSEGVEMTVPINVSANVDEKNKKASMDTTVEMMGFKVTTESYLDMTGDKTITYTKSVSDDEEWTKSESNDQDISGMSDIIKAGTKVSKKSTKEKDVIYYQVTVSKETMEKYMKEMGDTEDLTGTVEFNDDVVMDVYISKDKKYLKKIYIDFSKFVKIEEEGTEMTEFNLEISFDKYNKVGNVEIPQEVIDNAVEEDETDYDFDYEEEV